MTTRLETLDQYNSVCSVQKKPVNSYIVQTLDAVNKLVSFIALFKDFWAEKR
jgi:hypothetical protein